MLVYHLPGTKVSLQKINGFSNKKGQVINRELDSDAKLTVYQGIYFSGMS